MEKKISIAIDAMGGDNSPNKTIEGVKIFLDKNNVRMQSHALSKIFSDFTGLNRPRIII